VRERAALVAVGRGMVEMTIGGNEGDVKYLSAPTVTISHDSAARFVVVPPERQCRSAQAD
jgi:hypothetical protein